MRNSYVANCFFSVLLHFLKLLNLCKVENQIYLREVLYSMKKLTPEKEPIPFDLVVWAFNRKNKFAGREIIYTDAELMQQANPNKISKIFKLQESKDPNHFLNRTRNIKLPNGEVKTIHIIFIKSFNGKTVVY